MSDITLEKLKHDYDVSDHTEKPIEIPEKPEKGLVLVVGSSGSGKSTIIKDWFGSDIPNTFNNDISVIENFETLEIGISHLKAFGLRSVPTWFRPFNTLSNGEAHRAECALSVSRGALFVDEFTSVVDRDTAKTLACAVRRFFKEDELFVVATCHRDIEEWLCPDVVYDTDMVQYKMRRYLRRPKIPIQIRASTHKDWIHFKRHHYLTDEVSKSCHFYTAFFGEKMVGFLAIIHGTGRDIRSYWRESRVVVLPEFQGVGIGTMISEAVGDEYVNRGLRYFSKTVHPSFGEHRNNSPKWRPTSMNGKKRMQDIKKDGSARRPKSFGKTSETILRDAYRMCYSHEYMGEILGLHGPKSLK